MPLFHRHKFGTAQEDGYQYCEGCGKAVFPPCGVCDHKWSIHSECKVKNQFDHEKTDYLVYVLRCEHCGEMRNHLVP